MKKLQPQVSPKSAVTLFSSTFASAISLGCLALLTACGGGGGGSGPDPSKPLSVRASVSGMTYPGLVLQNSGGDDLKVDSNGIYNFIKPIAKNGSYSVTVKTQPTGQTCTVVNGTGTGVTTEVPLIKVMCSVNTYSIAGSVSGLIAGSQLVVSNNSADPITITSDGKFSFKTPVAYNSAYTVTVDDQPTGQVCTVTNNTGSGVNKNIDDISIVCSVLGYTISGVVNGLNPGNQVTIYNNNSEPILVTQNGNFMFAIPVAYNGSYSVTVGTQPDGQACTVTNYSGSGVVRNIDDVVVSCSTNTYSISGTVSGLNAAGPVTLFNNGSDPLSIDQNGVFTFATPVAHNGSYAVTVGTHPPGQTCSVTRHSGNGVVQDILDVEVVCAINSYNIGGTVSGLNPGNQVTLINNGDDSVIVGSDGIFNFATPVAFNGSYVVTVGTQPTGQTCTVNNPSGDGVVQDVSDINVLCSTHTFSISGSVVGLLPGNQVTLYNNGADPLTVGSDGGFSFATPVVYNGSYAVTVLQPVGQTCTVSNNSGNGVTQDIENVLVTCSIDHYTISGTINGLNAGGQITLHNNASDPITITANGGFTFATPVAYNGSYAVTIGTPPLMQSCQVTNGSGSNVSSDISTVQVSCNAANVTLLSSMQQSTGAALYAGIVAGRDGNYYGVKSGGIGSRGMVYKMTPQGAVTAVYTFPANLPYAGLVQGADGNFYGTTVTGGVNDNGTVYKVTPQGAFTELASLDALGSTNSRPTPYANMVQGLDGNFYGTTPYGGQYGYGAIFKVTPTGALTRLYSFQMSGTNPYSPYGDLVVGSDGNFYGTTAFGGANGDGAIFKITPQGVLSVIHSFNNASGEGKGSVSGLALGIDGNLYGVAANGGAYGQGTIFKVTPQGTFTRLHSMNASSDGASPAGTLVLGSDGNFYGTSYGGGINNSGGIFKISPQGNFSVLHLFSNGEKPYAGLTIGSDLNLYGTSQYGGTNKLGTIFKFGS